MPESFTPAEGSWEALPEQSATALRQALLHSLEMENPNFDSPAALRAGVKEAIAQNKLAEVRKVLSEQVSDANREELESLQELLSQEAKLHHFEKSYETQMCPEEENAVISFLKEHRLAIAIIGVGLIGGLQAAGIVTLFSLPQVIEKVQDYFSSASETVQGWWQNIQSWFSGDTGSAPELAAETTAGQVAEQIVEETTIPYDEDPPPNTSTPENSTEFTEPSPSDLPPEGADPFAPAEAGEAAGTM